MVGGYMVYHSTMYFSEYLPQVVGDINVLLLWDVNSTYKFEGEVMLGEGRWRKVKGILIFYYNYYFLTQFLNLSDWCTKYIFFFHPSSGEWDAMDLYIQNNIEWMKIWIE